MNGSLEDIYLIGAEMLEALNDEDLTGQKLDDFKAKSKVYMGLTKSVCEITKVEIEARRFVAECVDQGERVPVQFKIKEGN